MTKATEFAPRVMQLVTTQDTPEVARMTIYGDIAGGIDWGLLLTGEPDGQRTGAMDVAQAVAALPDTCTAIEVHINSYGGEVAEGVAIYNALRASGREVTTVCDGFACSIASVVFMAGSRRVMRPASMLMLHNPSMGGYGTSAQLRKQADDLDEIAKLSKAAYLREWTEAPEELDAMMDAETWVAPDRAVELGLATEQADPTDGDAPTQSAAQAVMSALTTPRATPIVASVAPTDEQVRAIADRVIAAIKAPAQATEPMRAPEPTLMQHLKTMLS